MGAKDHTPAWKLFNYSFHCRVPHIHTRTEIELAARSPYSSGDVDQDNAVALEPIDTMLTIEQITTYLDDGVQVTLAKLEDSVRIYGLLRDFLEGTEDALERSLNFHIKDTSFIESCDRLAAEMYRIGSPYFTMENRGEKAQSRLRNFGTGVGRGVDPDAPAKKRGEYKPISDSISKKAMERKRLWR